MKANIFTTGHNHGLNMKGAGLLMPQGEYILLSEPHELFV